MADAAEQTLRESLEKVALEQNYDDPEITVTAVSTEGANFTSFLFESTISSKGKDDLNLFSKVSAVCEKFRSQAPMRVFDNERIFYTELMKDYKELEEKHGVPIEHQFKIPKAYTISPNLYKETFVMENLSTKGYLLHDRLKSVDWDYAKAAFSQLAKMHALSMALRLEQPEKFKRYTAEFKFEMDLQSEQGGNFLESIMKQGPEKILAAIGDEYKDRLMAFLGQLMAGGLETFMKIYAPGENPVIRHSDFRPSNLMHKRKEDGSLEIVVVDFQTLIASTHIADILYFIFLGTDKEFRDQYYDRLIDHYYEELSAALTRLGLDPEKTYSRQKYDEDLKENLAYGLVAALITLPLVTVTEVPEMTGEEDMESLTKMKLSSVCIDRIKGVLADFTKWGVL